MVTKLSIRSALFGPPFRKTKIQTFFSDWYRMFSILMSSITSYGKKIGHELQKYIMKCTLSQMLLKLRFIIIWIYCIYLLNMKTIVHCPSRQTRLSFWERQSIYNCPKSFLGLIIIQMKTFFVDIAFFPLV